MLARLRTNPVLRAGFLAVALAFCGLGLADSWPQAQLAVTRTQPYSVAAAFVAAAAGSFCLTMAWRAVLADLGSRLPVPAAVHVMSVSQVAKYLPGAIWAFAAQVELGYDYRVDRRRSTAAVIISLAVALGTGLLLAAVTIPVASAGAARHYRWFLAAAPLVAVCLAPPVLRRLLQVALRLARRPPLERLPSSRGLLIAVGWTMLGWLLWGTQAWLLIGDLAGHGLATAALSVGGYALAWSAGLVLVLFPGGIGPRELAFVLVLAPILPRGSALLVALVSRLVMTASDFAWAGTGLIIGRLTRHSRAQAAASPRPAIGHPVGHRWPMPVRPAEAAGLPVASVQARGDAGPGEIDVDGSAR